MLLFQFLVLAGNRFMFYILLMYLEYHSGVVLCQFLWFWWEIVFGVTYILSVRYSCAVMSVFWLWQEIVFKMRTRFYKKSYWVTFYDPLADMCFS